MMYAKDGESVSFDYRVEVTAVHWKYKHEYYGLTKTTPGYYAD